MMRKSERIRQLESMVNIRLIVETIDGDEILNVNVEMLYYFQKYTRHANVLEIDNLVIRTENGW